ncbi:undecaprenyl-diphosphate phosphatase [Gynuella sp.]|uniref:undecaprenyl-diphosphate phosphatase n=1 Tax=Gynuella sp. TaxID=2969146 RepID=UPI003D149F08
MDFFHILFLSLIQGFTEFLPISSSAHLILPSQVLGWPDQGLAFDVSVHVGSLLAVVIYFRKDLIALAQQWFLSLVNKHTNPQQVKMAWFIIVATIPAGLAGFLFEGFIEDNFRSVLVIATTTVVFGILLGLGDRKKHQQLRSESLMTWKDTMIIGVAQAVALIPGTSRSGITMTAALFLGLDRVTASRFSFLLSIPLILAAGLLKTVELSKTPMVGIWDEVGLGALLSFLSAYLCIFLFLKLINRIGFMPFVLYRLFLGGVLFLFWVLN